ncbi:hypothetical protein A3I99_03005 [Candidatus Kaiserbacteria bacterium RIFCSPLOWO2_02_FULL_45_11b]|uniref:TrpR like protein, YerC/YecD n=1 Tax=Candidatus Kaiserbacteria bacterium RIFCSPLOWO2_12_FULL_45_26 TaxID=1798525 RepID=A0A1F6FGM5_9BACT|nr:MAG: hypothetical protein A2Z56_04405 [Candidatus Kaiserbacteria bacterium RIFCSPHIGHO2_12_45_16]OGG71091.1 MAG: hypothetical protein A2929_02070 [Candidatus Kaiserbacteria bacterium RIFCSPLOWO2_01_FULL_45_25]OGG81720.1 MAG: hypothetical protein A3I99_03005 [Candidatus Kaiserbacteria bacterium RIFCSPLOWO2_02_FULL_45_11b]OGG85017.1 MAG: hypothetical protein A3G90_03060 [Candidatus Kaiserbacteria bacterium RIFCSPLOWO2_12_FULL_45_26]
MTNISKNKLPEEDFQKLFKKMTEIMTKAQQTDIEIFLSDLLGKEEKIMLVKRFIAVVMLCEGNSSYRIWRTLNISPSTADKIRLDYVSGRYRKLTSLFKRQPKKYHRLWQTLELVLQAGLPPRGSARWSSLLRSVSKHK